MPYDRAASPAGALARGSALLCIGGPGRRLPDWHNEQRQPLMLPGTKACGSTLALP